MSNRSLGVKLSEITQEDLERIMDIKLYYEKLLSENDEFREQMLKMCDDNEKRISDCCNLEVKEYLSSIKNKNSHN
jgi:hypothetical protein